MRCLWTINTIHADCFISPKTLHVKVAGRTGYIFILQKTGYTESQPGL